MFLNYIVTKPYNNVSYERYLNLVDLNEKVECIKEQLKKMIEDMSVIKWATHK